MKNWLLSVVAIDRSTGTRVIEIGREEVILKGTH
jgi:hypothetical protein